MTGSQRPQVAEPQALNSQITAVLHNVVAERNTELAEHESRVARLARGVAAELDLPDGETDGLIQAAYLHDIGKLALPDSVLDKPAALDEQEWALVRRHTLIGEGILKAVGARHEAAGFVRSSHECFDGSGYPDGLVAEEIPLAARIIAACDAYDAMTSPRPYRPIAMTDDIAVVELRRSSGTQFDPRVVNALCALPAAKRTGL